LMSAWRGMGDPGVASPIARRSGQAWPCGIGPGICRISYVDFREKRVFSEVRGFKVHPHSPGPVAIEPLSDLFGPLTGPWWIHS
jgi:hypothetical protein